MKPSKELEAPLPRLLFVDDDESQWGVMRRLLARDFEVVVAASGPEGLKAIEEHGPFPVVLTDMEMPHMSGGEFLARVRKVSPDTVRLLLTGQADFAAAVAAVNEGQIFRFLTKPWEYRTLLAALEAALEQHRLITSERVLLSQTVRGSIQMLVEILALASPLVFGRATRVKRYAAELAKAVGAPSAWEIEVAAMLSQIGCVALPAATIDKLYHGGALSRDERARTEKLPEIADGLLANIPRLEGVRACLLLQHEPFGVRRTEAPLGARILKIVLDFDVLEARGNEPSVAIDTMRSRVNVYDPSLFATFANLRNAGPERSKVREIEVTAVTPGMIFVEDVRNEAGVLLIARGYRVTESLVERIRRCPVEGLVRVRGPGP